MPGMDTGQALPIKSNSQADKTFTGQLSADRRINYKAAKFVFTAMSQTDKNNIDQFFFYCDVVTPFLLLIWENDLSVEMPIYAALTKDLDWQRDSSAGVLYNLSLDIEEVF
jgi:hypothetical protein